MSFLKIRHIKNYKANFVVVFLFLFFLLSSCTKEKLKSKLNEENYTFLNLPDHFPKIPEPKDNLYSKERWELGKMLFFDTRLSIDNSISCATCHLQYKAFTGDKPKNPGVFNRPGKRNAPTLTNVAYQPYLLTEGSVPTLEMQVLVPVQEENEFAHNIVAIVDELKNDLEYQKRSKKAYNREFDAYVLTRAIGNYERSLISANSKYDRVLEGKETFTTEEKLGKDLFFSSKTNCSSCHSGVFFTDFSFKNNGLYKDYTDEGRYHFTWDKNDIHKFKVPTLRNVEYTAPYMSDGSFNTLEEIVDHYNSGGKGNFQQSELIKPLGLTNKEKKGLVAFLKTLSDEEFIKNPLYFKDK